jgi:hypothetical protein
MNIVGIGTKVNSCGGCYIRPEMSPCAQSRNDTPSAADRVSATRHVSPLLGTGDGVKGRSRRLPVREAQRDRPEHGGANFGAWKTGGGDGMAGDDRAERR